MEFTKGFPPLKFDINFFFENGTLGPHETSRRLLIGFKLHSDQETHISPFRSLEYRKLQETESTH